MKKILALVLAALMVMTAVSAFAAGSKENKNINYGTTDDEEVTLGSVTATAKLQEIIDAVTAAAKDGDALKGLPEDVAAKIPAEMKTINEMTCWQLSGDPTKLSELELVFKFETPYEEGEEVTLLIGISPADADVEWLVLTGKGNADGDVVVKVTSAELNKIANNPFIVIPVSK